MSSNDSEEQQTAPSVEIDSTVDEEQASNAEELKQRVDAEKMVYAKLQQVTANIVRASNGLPKVGDGYELYASYPDFAKFMEQQRLRIILAMRKILAHLGCRIKISTFTLEDMERIIFANDLLVERVGISFEEHQRKLTQEFIVKTKVNIGAETVPGLRQSLHNSGTKSLGVKDGGRYATMFGKNVESVRLYSNHSMNSSSVTVKPQTAFQDSIVNADMAITPKLIVKHNAIKTITKSNFRIIDETANDQTLIDETNLLKDSSFAEHPYANEIAHFVVPPKQLEVPKDIGEAPKLSDTPLILVDDEEKLRDLVSDLNKCEEFAVDVEHNSHRSFLGLTCLVQISTRTVDYIVDPFPVWKSMYWLNEPFTNPNIVKIFHAGDSDVIWLQRDFGIYVINLFDTTVAMRQLGINRVSLKNLLSEFCGITLNKQLQTADWRVRPLPEPYLHYARMDSHYLLNCYDKLREKLSNITPKGKKSSVIENVFMKCRQISYRLFEQPRFDEHGYKEVIKRGRQLSNRQVYALKQLWQWRDTMAREHDESLHYVLPTHMMFLIAEALPRDMNGILACCAPVPPLVRHNVATLFKYISTARELPLKKYLPASSCSVDPNEEDEYCPDPSMESNRITDVKAKLEYHIDCTNFKASQEIPTALSRVQALKDTANPVEEKKNSSCSFVLTVESKDGRTMIARMQRPNNNNNHGKDGSNCIYVEDERDNKVSKSAEERLKRVHDRLSRWQMPFTCYLATKRYLDDQSTAGISDTPPTKKKTDTITTTMKEATTKTEVIEE